MTKNIILVIVGIALAIAATASTARGGGGGGGHSSGAHASSPAHPSSGHASAPQAAGHTSETVHGGSTPSRAVATDNTHPWFMFWHSSPECDANRSKDCKK